MRRPVLLLAVVATALLLAVPAGPVAAVPQATPSPDPTAARALALLTRAATAARARGWSGTQTVSSWRDDGRSSLVHVEHDPRWGTRVRSAAVDPVTSAAVAGPGAAATPAATVVPAAEADAQLLEVLARHYRLAVVSPGSCSGRPAEVVEARRPGGAVAARLWLDSDSGLALRRDLFDAGGRRVRSTEFVSLAVGAEQPGQGTGSGQGGGGQQGGQQGAPGREVGEAELAQLRSAGEPVPEQLPGGFTLFDARRTGRDGAVLHLAYSDGLSSLSLFSQPGSAGTGLPAGYRHETIAGSAVAVRPGPPTRLIWGGGGRVFTLVTDAAPEDVAAAVGALPRQPAHAGGVRGRLQRGVSRLASWTTPFG